MSLIHNERTKLPANALDRTSTACIAVGLIAPVVGDGVGATWSAAAGTIVWLLAAIALHWGSKAGSWAAGMTGFQLFCFVILPVAVAALGWAAVFWHERTSRRSPR